jgi:hypothetical protein
MPNLPLGLRCHCEISVLAFGAPGDGIIWVYDQITDICHFSLELYIIALHFAFLEISCFMYWTHVHSLHHGAWPRITFRIMPNENTSDTLGSISSKDL